MGNMVRQVAERRGHLIVTQVGRPSEGFWETLQAEAVIDFSHASQVENIVRNSLPRGLLLVTGTTGWKAQEASLRAWASSLPCARWVWGGNFSRGILLLKLALHALTRRPDLLAEWESALVETHHRRKKDAPSGTALELADILPPTHPITSLRVGEVIGEHTFLLSTVGEELVLTHRAHDRQIFAQGALWALEWLSAQNTGFVGKFEEIVAA